jgi:hypothetical protein
MQFLRRCAVGGTAQFFARKYYYVQPSTLTASRQLLPDLLAQPQNDSKTFESIEAIRRYPVVSLWCTVGFHSSAAALAAQDVVVPSMGDSITEGGTFTITQSTHQSNWLSVYPISPTSVDRVHFIQCLGIHTLRARDVINDVANVVDDCTPVRFTLFYLISTAFEIS